MFTPRIKLQVIQEEMTEYTATKITSSSEGFTYFKDLFKEDREHCVVLLLDAKNIPIGIHTVSIGSLSNAIVHPREVFKAAIMMNASGFILAHNHPSGDTEPSREDVQLTARLDSAAELLGIRLLDSLIIGNNNYYSFADGGQL